MNLFFLNYNVKSIASDHCNKHCIKMILELTQMLYTAWWFGRDHLPMPIMESCPYDPYRPTHKNHPVSIWVRASKIHYEWTLNIAFALCDEYYSRYGKIHKCVSHLERLQRMGAPKLISEETYAPPLTKRATAGLPSDIAYFDCAINDEVFPQCAVYTDGKLNAIETYRNYYKTKTWEMKWKKIPKWY